MCARQTVGLRRPLSARDFPRPAVASINGIPRSGTHPAASGVTAQKSATNIWLTSLCERSSMKEFKRSRRSARQSIERHKKEPPRVLPRHLRSRFRRSAQPVTAFFRLILAIPLAIWLYVYAKLAYIAVVIASFAILSPAPIHRASMTSSRGSRVSWRASPPTRSCCAIPTPPSAAPMTPPIRCG